MTRSSSTAIAGRASSSTADPSRTDSSSRSMPTCHRGIGGSTCSSSVTRTRTTSRGSPCCSRDIGSAGWWNPGCAARAPATVPGRRGSRRRVAGRAGSAPVTGSASTMSVSASCGPTRVRCRRSRPTPARASTTCRSSSSGRSARSGSSSPATSRRASTRSFSPAAFPGLTCSRSPTTAAGRRRPPHSSTRPGRASPSCPSGRRTRTVIRHRRRSPGSATAGRRSTGPTRTGA